MTSNLSSFAQSCEVVTRLNSVPEPMRDIVRQQSDDLSLPLTVCSSLDIFFLAPFLLAAVFLLLPDFSEIGFGGVALRRFQEQITETVEEASSRLETRISNAAGISKNIEKGLLLKGEIRNIELRMATIRTLLLSFVDEKDPTYRRWTVSKSVTFGWGNLNCVSSTEV